ncbi:leukocyte-associated immunoglobulin-like receptor 1 isoform X2 [Globicephala melas]|uniref:leukocyte-associated immunoglobulin-like receptor 1 isoform X2 n=1 Tax=Globicephala melas TaxID=9731 RepID=UPI00122F16F5|nr:leukocyte-associated immunoglobulin-like receptor 1 isoform X2 [Globicephala melas]
MSPRPTTLLGLVLCLGHTMHTQAGTLPSRSTRAEPDSVSPQGWPVTIVCRGPAGAEEFRLERKDNRSDFKDEKTVFQIGPYQTEARFCITAVSRDAAQHYQCLHRKGNHWSEPSEPLDLPVTGLPTEHLYILIGVPVAFLLCLLLLGLFLLHRRHERKRGPPRSKGEEQRPQERLSPAVDVADETPDLATVDRLPEKSGEVDTSASAAGGPQEVIYAQLDHPAFTQRVARAASPLSTEPTAKSSMYAVLARN